MSTQKRQLSLFPEATIRPRPAVRPESGHFRLDGRVKSMESIRRNQRRYYYHSALKRLGIEVEGATRTIELALYDSFQDIPVPTRWYVNQLLKMGYNAQFKIL